MTIYEVFYDFFDYLFPVAIKTAYADTIELLTFVTTIIFCYVFILIPLYKLGTFFLRKGR